MFDFLKKYIKKKLRPVIVNIIRETQRDDRLEKEQLYRACYHLSESFSFGDIEHTILEGANIFIDDGSYINSGRIQSGTHSKVVIGKWCAIGYNVNILATTHDVEHPTGPEDDRQTTEADIIIGDRVWIGSNVFIREGVTIGNDAVVGANSVVTKDIPAFAVAGGIPATVLYYKNKSNE